MMPWRGKSQERGRDGFSMTDFDFDLKICVHGYLMIQPNMNYFFALISSIFCSFLFLFFFIHSFIIFSLTSVLKRFP